MALADPPKPLWKGLFKSYEVYSVVPLTKMSAADWRWLEWENLSNVAKNRIAEKVGEDFYGFANIRIFSKGQAKERYVWPIDSVEAQSVLDSGVPQFSNYADVAELTVKAVTLENNVSYVGSMIAISSAAAAMVAVKILAQRRELESLVKELEEMTEAGFSDFYELDQALSLAILLQKYFPNSSALENFIDDAEQILGEAEDARLY